MHGFKKVVAIGLAATMILGGAVTAFADETNTGNSTGIGTPEGHVDKKATNVVLPTIETGSTPFAYTMDPERLITETSHAKYGNTVEFPASNDTGVYFNNGKKGGTGDDKENIVYANTSLAQTVTNKSSHAISLTVKAEATTATTDVPLVAKSAIEDAEAASLYLGLIVGSETPVALSGTTAATKTVSIAGSSDNFKTAVESGAYVYRALTLDEYKALDGNSAKTQDDYDATWAKTTFQLEGAVTADKAITSTTTAPTVKVTWSWVDPSATPTRSSAAAITVPESGKATVAITVGTDGAVPTSLTTTWFAGNLLESTNGWGATYDSSTKVLTFDTGISGNFQEKLDDAMNATYTITFTPSEGDAYTQVLTFAE